MEGEDPAKWDGLVKKGGGLANAWGAASNEGWS